MFDAQLCKLRDVLVTQFVYMFHSFARDDVFLLVDSVSKISTTR